MTEWIFDTMLVTFALLTGVLLLRKPVARIFGPGIAYGLWLLPAARAVMPSLERQVAVIPETAPAIPANLPLAALTANSKLPQIAALPAVDWTQLAMTLWLGIAALIFITQMLRYVSMREALLASANMIPEIDISENSGDCRDGDPVSNNVSGFDGKGRASVRMIICGKAIAQAAKAAALESLRDTAHDIRSEEDMPASVQRKVLRQLEQLERETASES